MLYEVITGAMGLVARGAVAVEEQTRLGVVADAAHLVDKSDLVDAGVVCPGEVDLRVALLREDVDQDVAGGRQR